MTQRTIVVGKAPNVIIKAGGSVIVKGDDGEQVIAGTNDRWGLKVERKQEHIEVQIGSNGTVFVPLASHVKIYAGKSIDVQSVKGQVDGYAGLDLIVQDVYCLGHA